MGAELDLAPPPPRGRDGERRDPSGDEQWRGLTSEGYRDEQGRGLTSEGFYVDLSISEGCKCKTTARGAKRPREGRTTVALRLNSKDNV
jgi:hypothetical protein